MVEGDPHAATPSPASRTSGETVEQALRSAFDLYGPDMLYAAERLQTFLAERCPGADSDIALVMAGLDEQVPQALLSAHTTADMRLLLPRLQARLIDQRSLNRYAAAWAVDTWTSALRLKPEPIAPDPLAFAGAALADEGAADASDPAIGRSTDDREPVGGPVASAAPTASAEPAAPPRPVAPSTVAQDAAPAASALPRWADAAGDPLDEDAPSSARSISVWSGIGAAIVAVIVIVFAIRYQGTPATTDAAVAERSAATSGAPVTASVAPVAASVATAAGAAASTGASTTEPMAPNAAANRETAAPASAAAASGAVTPEVPATPNASAGASTAPVATPSAAPSAAPTVAPPLAPSAAPSAAPTMAPSSATAAATPEVASRIADVVSDGPLVGDDTPRSLWLKLTGRGDTVRSVTSRFVSGDESLRVAPTVADVPAASPGDGRVPAGAIRVRTTRPVKAVFEFTATFADGRQSPPFRKELTVQPTPSQPVITRVKVPVTIIAGQPFWLAIAYEAGSGRLASVDRSIAAVQGQAASKVTRVAVASLEKSDDGALLLPIRSARAGTGTTMSLTLVDAAGHRSAPYRVVFDVQPSTIPPHGGGASDEAARRPSGKVDGARVPAPPATAAAAAPGRQASMPPCTGATCGSVVAVHELESATARLQSASPVDRARRSYEVLVRTDDRVIHTFRQATPLGIGSRVRLEGERMVSAPALPKVPTARPARPDRKLLPESVPLFGQ